MTEPIKNNIAKGSIEAMTGKELPTKGVIDKVEPKGVFDIAKENGIPTGGAIEAATGKEIPMGGAIEAATGKKVPLKKGALEIATGKDLPKMGLIDVISKYGQGVFQKVRDFFSK